jgi:hypothetical protein
MAIELLKSAARPGTPHSIRCARIAAHAAKFALERARQFSRISRGGGLVWDNVHLLWLWAGSEGSQPVASQLNKRAVRVGIQVCLEVSGRRTVLNRRPESQVDLASVEPVDPVPIPLCRLLALELFEQQPGKLAERAVGIAVQVRAQHHWITALSGGVPVGHFHSAFRGSLFGRRRERHWRVGVQYCLRAGDRSDDDAGLHRLGHLNRPRRARALTGKVGRLCTRRTPSEVTADHSHNDRRDDCLEPSHRLLHSPIENRKKQAYHDGVSGIKARSSARIPTPVWSGVISQRQAELALRLARADRSTIFG